MTDSVRFWGAADEGGLPSIEDLTSTRPAPSMGETVDEVRDSLGIGVRRERPGDRPDAGGLASELRLADG